MFNLKIMKTILRSLTILVAFGSAVQGQTSELTLKPSDVIALQISGIPQEEALGMNHAYRINDRGTITGLTFLDEEIKAAGLKPSELERAIVERYKSKQIYLRPSVSISVDQMGVTERMVYIMGAVVKPGPVPYRPAMKLADAIASGGGANTFGDLRKVKVVRSGKSLGIFDCRIEAKGNDGQLQLEPNDQVSVPD
jgi:protein involved in polysaccharide export with SLBB domain